jgi:hypothetical protein
MNGYGRRTCQCFMPAKDEEILENRGRAAEIGRRAGTAMARLPVMGVKEEKC